jgi:cell division protein FtsN
MNNLIKFLIYLLVILLLVSWLITVGKSCGKSSETTNDSPVLTEMNVDSASDLMEDLEEEVDFTEELESILDEEETSYEQVEEEGVPVTDNSDAYEDEPEAAAPKKEEVKKEAPKKSDPVYNNVTPSNSSFPGNYLVVAGSFIHPDYANGHSKKIANMGYDAEVVVFELSEYHTVLAGRFETQSAAQAIVDKLKQDGFDAYVKKRTR